jgi:response regulator RpfG family c-di-GMP phosphodiesterase
LAVCNGTKKALGELVLNIDGLAKKILCIDKDPDVSKVMVEIVNQSFDSNVVQVFFSATIDQGLQKMQEEIVDIVLCHAQIKGDQDGFEVCREIRKKYPRCAVITMSDFDPETDYANKANSAGAEAHLSKPIRKGEFLFAVNSILRGARQDNTIHEKNQQLEQALSQLKAFHKKVASLNQELQTDKRYLGTNLQEMKNLNAQLEEKNTQISSMVEELGRRFESTEALLVNIIELRQPEHRGHVDRVAKISMFIAEKMVLSDYQTRNINTAARLHELGIAALPTMEKRKEALDEGKNRSHTNHPLVGEMLLKGFPGFEMIANIIRHLHENVDGSGFPDKLYGDRIPLGSRIVSAASYFDHFRTSNPEKSPMDAMAIMSPLSGKFFDEQVMDFLGKYAHTQMGPEQNKTLDCSVFALVEGMELASNIYSESGINLLMKGTVLNADILSKILKFHAVDPIDGAVKIKQPT